MLVLTKEIKNKIKHLVNNKNWTIVCDRIVHFMEKHNTRIDRIEIVKTSDFKFAYRNHRSSYYKNIVICENVGVVPNSNNRYFMFACIVCS